VKDCRKRNKFNAKSDWECIVIFQNAIMWWVVVCFFKKGPQIVWINRSRGRRN